MTIGMRGIAGYASGEAETIPYVTDGLVAMWDGIWNVGIGVHSAAAKVWTDLCGKYTSSENRTTAGYGWHWGDDCYVGDTAAGAGFIVPLPFSTVLQSNVGHHTLEIVASVAVPANRCTIFGQWNATTGANFEQFTGGLWRPYYNATPDLKSTSQVFYANKPVSVASVVGTGGVTAYANAKVCGGESTVPTTATVNSGLQFVIGGEHLRPAQSIVGKINCIRLYNRTLALSELQSNSSVDAHRFHTQYDYEVEYLQSTGTQYINTGFVPDNTSGFEVVAETDKAGTVPVGARQTNGDTRWWTKFDTTIEFSWNGYNTSSRYSTGTKYTIGHNWLNSRTGTIDGEVVCTSYPTLESFTYPAWLFTSNSYGSSVFPLSGKIYSCRFSRGSEVVMDLIPVVKDGVGYMYDKVGNKLYGNSGTGSFTPGPKVS